MGNVTLADVQDKLPTAFMSKVRLMPNGCWMWLGTKPRGYFPPRRRQTPRPRVKAHRFTYEALIGPIPKGLEPDHLCRNTWCCNPRHLELVTHAENVRRGEAGGDVGNRAKTQCPLGHPYDEGNTYRRPDRPGRNCNVCKKEAYWRWYLKKQAAA